MTAPRVLWPVATAVAFLTRIPVPTGATGAEPSAAVLARSVAWFPLVGLLVGTAVGLTHVGLTAVAPAPVAATVAVTVGLIVTGGFHEDGLADTADGLGGGRDRDGRLTIMADPRLGTFGTLALIVSVLGRVAALAALAGPVAVGAAVAAHVLGRTAAMIALVSSPAARPGGLADAVAGGSRVAIAVSALVWTGALTAWLGPSALAVVLALSAPAALVVVALARRTIGGVTGDVLGAVEQVVELTVLVTAATTWFAAATRLAAASAWPVPAPLW